MGRRKIEILPIVDDRNRSVTFLKRKNGLFKKAYELGVLCNADVAVIVFATNGKLYEFGSGDMDSILLRYSNFDQPSHERRGPQDFINKANAQAAAAAQNAQAQNFAHLPPHLHSQHPGHPSQPPPPSPDSDGRGLSSGGGLSPHTSMMSSGLPNGMPPQGANSINIPPSAVPSMPLPRNMGMDTTFPGFYPQPLTPQSAKSSGARAHSFSSGERPETGGVQVKGGSDSTKSERKTTVSGLPQFNESAVGQSSSDSDDDDEDEEEPHQSSTQHVGKALPSSAPGNLTPTAAAPSMVNGEHHHEWPASLHQVPYAGALPLRSHSLPGPDGHLAYPPGAIAINPGGGLSIPPGGFYPFGVPYGHYPAYPTAHGAPANAGAAPTTVPYLAGYAAPPPTSTNASLEAVFQSLQNYPEAGATANANAQAQGAGAGSTNHPSPPHLAYSVMTQQPQSKGP